MRLSMVMTSLSRLGGGLTPAICGLSSALNAIADCSVSVYGITDRYTNDDKSCWGDIPTRYFRAYGPRAWGYSPGLLRAVEESAADIVHRHGIWDFPSRAVWRVARRIGTPYVVSVHGSLNSYALGVRPIRKNIFGKLFERKFLKHASCIHALSPAEEMACRQYGLKNPIAVIPNGIEPAPPDPKATPPWPEPSDGRNVLLFIGRLHPIKGLPTLLQAFAKALKAAERNNWRLVIAGWEQQGHLAELKALSVQLGISRHVDFLDGLFGLDKSNALYRANAFVLSSKSEAQPVAALEAWSYGLATVLTEACNLTYASDQGLSLINDGTVSGMAASLEEMFSMSDSRRNAMGLRAQNYTETAYCWRGQAEKMHAVYRWLAAGTPPPSFLKYP